jgi:hypothetical protein
VGTQLALAIFQIGSCFYTWAGLDHNTIYVCHDAQLLLVEIGSLQLFAQAGLKWQSFQSPPPE